MYNIRSKDLKCVCEVLGLEHSEELGLYWIHCVCVGSSFACLNIFRSEICCTIFWE